MREIKSTAELSIPKGIKKGRGKGQIAMYQCTVIEVWKGCVSGGRQRDCRGENRAQRDLKERQMLLRAAVRYAVLEAFADGI